MSTRARSVLCLLIAISLSGMHAKPLGAKVLLTKEKALKLAFPEADSVSSHDFFLTQDQVDEFTTLLNRQPKSRLVRVYVGSKKGKPNGFAFTDTHTVRTHPETLLAVFDLNGHIQGVHVVSFFEPKEYLAPGSWLKQFQRLKSDSEGWQHRVDGISGATLTAQAVTNSVKQLATLYSVWIQKQPFVANRLKNRQP